MNREEIQKEILRVEDAISRTKSPALKRDYGKYVARLRKKAGFERGQKWKK